VLRSPFRRLLFQEEFTGKSVDNRSWGVWDFAANMDPRRVRNNAAHDMVRLLQRASIAVPCCTRDFVPFCPLLLATGARMK
jgi:hypothetical protein